MPILKVNIEEKEQQEIEKEYFEKIAKKKPDQLTLYKKCYYAEDVSYFTNEEKTLRKKIRKNIIWTYRYRFEEGFKESFNEKQSRNKLIKINKLKKAKEKELRKAKKRELKEAKERELKEAKERELKEAKEKELKEAEQKEEEWHIIPDYLKNKIVKRKRLPKEKILSCVEIQKRLSGFTISKNSQRSKKFKYSIEVEKQIVEDTKRMTQEKVAKKWNCHEQTVQKILKRHHYERNIYKKKFKAH